MELYGYQFSRDEDLSHHGILGQKWGKRNGPPYPLKESDHSAAEKKAGWKKSLDQKVEKYESKSAEARIKINDLKANGLDSEAFKEEYGPSASWGNALFISQYGYSKNSALKKTIKKYERKEEKYTNKIANLQGKNLAKILGCSEEEAQNARHIAKVIGISLATTAGVVAIGYIMSNPELREKILQDPRNYFQFLDGNYNLDRSHAHSPIDLGDDLFKNSSNAREGRSLYEDANDPLHYIGEKATKAGYGTITGDELKRIIQSPDSDAVTDYDALVQRVRKDLVSGDATRRLSCWSASNAYYLSALTGGDFVSKSFGNLVNFNDFGKLYTSQPTIFNASGKVAKNFVGRFGSMDRAATGTTARDLVKSIAKNISEANNLTPDGSRTIGFVNAGYHGTTCTHQWNFELTHLSDGVKNIIMSDGYSGERYVVGKKLSNGKVQFDPVGISKLSHELGEYNASSIRFYAPSLSSINTDMMSNVVLNKS